MSNNKIHIVSFDVPWPADYGGAIDVFYKIKALHEVGAELYLHCFQYGRNVSKELAKLCKEVYYYPRKTGVKGMSLTLPYIVSSRENEELLQRLIAVDAPILFEGVHSTFYLPHKTLAQRRKAIRTHNIESEYYQQLALKESSFTKKQYFKVEASLLHKYEQQLQCADQFFCLSETDTTYFRKLYASKQTVFLAPFHPYNEVTSLTGPGKYCLYHGNLSHPENKEAALYLLNEVFPFTDLPVVIAGREPGKEIFDACKRIRGCKLIANPSQAEMHHLIEDAQVHVLPTFQASGMKLKLMYALFSGRHVLVNETMLHGTGLNGLCHIANDSSEWVDNINRLSNTPFTQTDITKRREALQANYNNLHNAERLLTYLLG